jgi:sporulation protein YpjB
MFWQQKKTSLQSIAIIAFLLLLLSACSIRETNPEQVRPDKDMLQKAEQLNRTADEMYKLMNQQDLLGARGKLAELNSQITQIRFDGMTSVEGLNALTELLTEAKRIYNAIHFSPESGMRVAAQIRLATDALTHTHQPMWLQYDKILLEDLSVLENATKAANQTSSVEALNKLRDHYLMIRPSIQISREPQEVERMDSLLVFMGRQLEQTPLPFAELETGMSELKRSMDILFDHKEAAAYLPFVEPKRPIFWSIGMGSVIIAVLAYSAWRMFGTEKNLVVIRRKK